MMELPKKTQLYEIKAGFARSKGIPAAFVAVPLAQTSKAVYLYGRGSAETVRLGRCCICGRTLTHPVSVELGIGPECGGHWHNWDLIGGYTKENLARLKGALSEMKIDTWLPKAVIKAVHKTQEIIDVPDNHMYSGKREKQEQQVVERKASKITFIGSGEPGIKITFPFNGADLGRVKTLTGRRFHNKGNVKYWTAPLIVESVEALKEWGFEIDSKLEAYLKKTTLSVDQVSDIDITVPGLKNDLFPFQRKGVAFIEAKDGRALVADEMGLGKTIQALAWLQLHPEKRPAVIVVPASLKINWRREAMSWLDSPNVQTLSGSKPNRRLTGDIIIVNYDILAGWLEALIDLKPAILITDECHYYKNNKAKRTKAIKKLGKKIPHVIALSGTPIVNRPIEMFNALQLIDNTVFPSFWKFAHRYCGAKHNGFGWDFTGSTNAKELHEKLTNTMMIRRLKSDVLHDLPDKLYSFQAMELGNEEEYSKAEKGFMSWLKDQKGDDAVESASNAEALVKIEALKQLAVQGKLDQAIKWIQDFLDVDGKLVVFAVHKFVVERLMKEFKEQAVKIDGSVSGPERDKAVQRFQTDPTIRLFVGNIKAAGVGLTLTAASNVAFLELPWTPGEVTQAEDRCHRIGQKDSVTVYYLLAADSIEETLAQLIDSKRRVLDAVLDGKETEQESLLSQLMTHYSEE